MEKIEFSKEEMELLKIMYNMFVERGSIPFLEAIAKGVERQHCIIAVNDGNKNKVLFFFNERHSEEANRKALCNVYSVLFFFKRLYSDGLIHSICDLGTFNGHLGLLEKINETESYIKYRFHGEEILVNKKSAFIDGYKPVEAYEVTFIVIVFGS